MSFEGNGGCGPVMEINDCDRGRHKLEARYDSRRVGDVFAKTYVCEVCVKCGHIVPREMSLREKLEAGVMSVDEARIFLEAQFQVAFEERTPLIVTHASTPSGDRQEARGERIEKDATEPPPAVSKPPVSS